MRNARVLSWCVALASIFPAAIWAASPSGPSTKAALPAKTVDLFAGMEAGEVEAVMIMADSTKGTVMVKNKTNQPLTIKMPAALAGVPILAQRAGRNGGGGAGGMGGGMGGGGGMQGMGGGMMGGMGGGMMGGGMGGGMFNVAPDKVQKIKIASVCLDHGLTDPSPRIPYKPIPIESYVKDPAVTELIKLLTAGQIDQHAAQAAAWHLQNGLSWEELAQKIGVKHINGTQEPYFAPNQLSRAFAATRLSKTLAENAAKETSPGKSPGDELAGQQ